MAEQLHFSYGNFCKLLATILYEKSHTPREITIFHQRFDDEKGDELIEQFLIELFHGATLGEEELKTLVTYIEKFMLKNKETQDLFVKYDKAHYSSYVYFKPDNKVYECEFAQHSKTVKEICCDFFKGFTEDEIDPQYLKNFIIENFEICSDNSTIEQIANDCDYITKCIIYQNKRSDNNA